MVEEAANLLGVFGAVGCLAKGVYLKYESVKALKTECRRARDIAKAVCEVVVDLDKEFKRKANPPPIGRALSLVEAGLKDAGDVLEMCSARPVQVKVCSGTYIGKLKASVSKMLEGMQLLGGANVGLSMEMQEQVSDVSESMQTMRSKLDGFVDAVGNEMRQVMDEHRNVQSQEVAEVVREVMIGVLGRDNSFERDEVERQLMQLAEEQDKVRQEKTFNREMEEELLRAVCAISLMQPENAANGAGGSAAACAPPQGPPDHFICPISLDVMQDPVIVVQSGITYERALIEQAMRFNPCRDPATNQEWSEPLTLAPNVLVRKMIREWQEQAPPPASQSSSRQVEPSSPPRSAARSDQIEQLNTRMRIEQSRGETPVASSRLLS